MLPCVKEVEIFTLIQRGNYNQVSPSRKHLKTKMFKRKMDSYGQHFVE